MQVPASVLVDEPDWVIGGYEDIFEAREKARKDGEAKRKMSSRNASSSRPASRRRRR